MPTMMAYGFRNIGAKEDVAGYRGKEFQTTLGGKKGKQGDAREIVSR
jgi:hypothetical protein